MTSNIYENEYYVLRVSVDQKTYEVVNKEYGVVEYSNEQLPGAYHVLYHLTNALSKRQWEWMTEVDEEEEDEQLFLSFVHRGDDTDAPTH